jgi:hypothetical protein
MGFKNQVSNFFVIDVIATILFIGKNQPALTFAAFALDV